MLADKVVQAPVPLLLHPGLTPSAKLLGLVVRLQPRHSPPRPAVLEQLTGLTRKTVLKGLAQLTAVGWHPTAAAGTPADSDGADKVPIPLDLLIDRRVGVRGRLLYGLVQLTPNWNEASGQFTYARLSALAQGSLPTIRRAVRELTNTQWLQVTQKNQLAPILASLQNPSLARGQAEVVRAGRRLNHARFYGEALMREYLSLLIDSDHFQDNADPGFLVNPLTLERMQLDRYYSPTVAFEFNGPQHYGATEQYSEEDAAKQRTRDLLKLGICVTMGIKLVVVHPDDLTLESMRQKIADLLPLRDLGGHEPLTGFLQSESRRYRRTMRRLRFPVPLVTLRQ